jgi:FkbM family methyltransferase
MSAASRRLAVLIARSLRAVRRRFFPNFDTRKSRLALAYLRWVKSTAHSDYVEGVVGHKMHLDERDSLQLSVTRVLEPVITRLFQQEIRPGQTVLDVGANIGYFTLLLARQVGPSGRVYAFEPDPTNHGILLRNVELNGYRNVTAVRRAVWDSTGPLRLFLSDENRGDHRVYDSDDGRPSVTIDAVRLDDFFEVPPRVDAIKMDIQGAERHALSGMRRLLESNRKLLLVTEFWPAALHRAGSVPSEYFDALVALGFTPSLVEEREERLVPIDRETLLQRFTVQNGDSADLVWRRG